MPPELPLFEVRPDGLFLVREPLRLASLPPPWGLAPADAPVLVDLKMQKDHLDQGALELLLHRRQTWQIAQIRATKQPNLPPPKQPAAWLVASHVPGWAAEPTSAWTWEPVAPGCYELRPCWFPLLWIASNELPLTEANIPFLVTRSNRPLVDFCKWVLAHRPSAWVLRRLQYVPMTQTQREELLRYFPPTDDPELLENRAQLARGLIQVFPQLRSEILDEGKKLGLDEGKKLGLELGLDEGKKAGQVQEARKAVERVLRKRGLPLSPEQQARLQDSGDLAELERWLDQAIVAPSTDDALR